jgi:hypothetical protein
VITEEVFVGVECFMSSDPRVTVVLSSMGRDRAGRAAVGKGSKMPRDLRRKSLTLDKSPIVERMHTERRGSFAASVSTSAVGPEKHERKGSIVHR